MKFKVGDYIKFGGKKEIYKVKENKYAKLGDMYYLVCEILESETKRIYISINYVDDNAIKLTRDEVILGML